MSSKSGTSLSKNAKRIHTKGRQRSGLLSLSESQTRAYLMARDLLRRVQRTSVLLFPEAAGTELRGRPTSSRPRDPSDDGCHRAVGERH